MPIISEAIFIVGLILGIIGMKKTTKKGISIAEVVLSSIGLVASISVGIVLLMMLIPFLFFWTNRTWYYLSIPSHRSSGSGAIHL